MTDLLFFTFYKIKRPQGKLHTFLIFHALIQIFKTLHVSDLEVHADHHVVRECPFEGGTFHVCSDLKLFNGT